MLGIGGFSLLAVLLGVMLARYIVHRANRSVGACMDFARSLAGGDLDARLPPPAGRNEFAMLSGAAPVTSTVQHVVAGALAASPQGRLDILVNNAGIIRRADSLDVTEEDWDAVINTNLKSLFFLSQAAAAHMAQHGGGKIINVASLLSFQGGIRVPAYTASKSAVAGLTRALANEWAAQGINVNALAPGYFDTNNTAALKADPDRNASILARIPAGRWGQPPDLGGAAVFLASRASDYVHGIVLPVDGGWLAR
eukprot:gene38008-46904_t